MLIFATGVYFTVRLGFFQFRHPVLLVKNTIVKSFQKKVEKDVAPGELTSFQGAMTSVSDVVDSGNIAGVATALVAGGPGALLWIVVVVVGSQSTLGFVWDLAITFNGLMIIPNLIGILLLSNEVVKLKKEYFAKIKS